MDPTTTASALAAAIRIHRAGVTLSPTWNESWDSLITWLERGGFRPNHDTLSVLLDELDTYVGLAEHYNQLSDLL